MVFWAVIAGIATYYCITLIQEEWNEKKHIQSRIDRLRWNSFEIIKTKNPESQKIASLFRIKKTNLFFESKQVLYSLVLFGVMTLLVYVVTYSTVAKILLLIAAVLLGIRFSYYFTKNSYYNKIRRELPGALDLTVICLGAGLGLNASLDRVSRELQGTALGIELRRIVSEINAGVPIEESLKNFAARVPVLEISAMVGYIIQSQRLGASILDTFQIQSETMREKYKMKIKEHLMRIPVLVLLPMVMFILPVIFLIVLIPALMSAGNIF